MAATLAALVRLAPILHQACILIEQRSSINPVSTRSSPQNHPSQNSNVSGPISCPCLAIEFLPQSSSQSAVSCRLPNLPRSPTISPSLPPCPHCISSGGTMRSSRASGARRSSSSVRMHGSSTMMAVSKSISTNSIRLIVIKRTFHAIQSIVEAFLPVSPPSGCPLIIPLPRRLVLLLRPYRRTSYPQPPFPCLPKPALLPLCPTPTPLCRFHRSEGGGVKTPCPGSKAAKTEDCSSSADDSTVRTSAPSLTEEFKGTCSHPAASAHQEQTRQWMPTAADPKRHGPDLRHLAQGTNYKYAWYERQKTRQNGK